MKAIDVLRSEVAQKVKLVYFKDSGKYYSEGTYESNCLYLWNIIQEIQGMKVHPGLIGRWSGPILVTTTSKRYGGIFLIQPNQSA